MGYSVVCADVLDWEYDGPKFHALLCDAPYELGFMGKTWDDSGVSFQPETWAALAEHLHPGAFGMTFAGSRTWHRIAVAIEDAGLVIHPSIFAWANAAGFPKATRIDAQHQKQRGVVKCWKGRAISNDAMVNLPYRERLVWYWHEKATKGHRYGLQALKPAVEPIIVFQKPYDGKPVECITATGAGALWVDGGRIGTGERDDFGRSPFKADGTRSEQRGGQSGLDGLHTAATATPSGRWPANFALVHSPGCERIGTQRVPSTGKWNRTDGARPFNNDGKPTGYEGWQGATDADGLETVAAWRCVESCPVRRLGEQSGVSGSTLRHSDGQGTMASWRRLEGRTDEPDGTDRQLIRTFGDTGTAARFFHQSDWSAEVAEQLAAADPVRYQAKAGRRERDAGLEEFAKQRISGQPSWLDEGHHNETGKPNRPIHSRNTHPTLKPIALVRWLATLLLPPAEYAPRRILVPFAGSGSEMVGCGLAGWDEIVGVEMMQEYCDIAEARLAHWEPVQLPLMAEARP